MALTAVLVSGCGLLPKSGTTSTLLPDAPEPSAQVGPREAANVKVEMAKMMEKRGESAAAMTTYQDAHAQDPKNVDAILGLARLLDAQGRFDESMPYYRQADKLEPKNTKVACNYGYSLYLQGRFPEAETALRQALARQPENALAHNNLGLVLARTGHAAEALGEFQRAGCGEADARANLAFALTLENSLPAAQAQYELALAADPNSAAAKKDLRDLDTVMTKSAPADAAKEGAEE